LRESFRFPNNISAKTLLVILKESLVIKYSSGTKRCYDSGAAKRKKRERAGNEMSKPKQR